MPSDDPTGSARGLRARAVRWVPFAVVALEIALIGTGLVSVRDGIVAVVAIEAALAALLVSEAAVLARGYRRGRGAGAGRGRSVELALAAALPPVAARLLVMEARTFGSLVRWLLRRRSRPALGEPETYGRNLRPLLVALLPVSVLELVVIELLVPWTGLRVVLLLLSAYFCFWLVGLVASMWARPHWVAPGGLVLNCMTFATLEVPLRCVARVRGVRVSGMRRSVDIDAEDEIATMSIMGSANVEVEFDAPVDVSGDRSCAVRRVRFYADRPADAIRAIEALSA